MKGLYSTSNIFYSPLFFPFPLHLYTKTTSTSLFSTTPERMLQPLLPQMSSASSSLLIYSRIATAEVQEEVGLSS